MTLRGFRTRMTVSFLALFAGVLVAVLLAVHAANTRTARQHVESQLVVTGRVFDRLIATRNRQLMDAARVLTGDYAFRAAVATNDHATLLSAMHNHRSRMKADLMLLASPDHRLLAGTSATAHPEDSAFPFPDIIERAQQAGEALGFVTTPEGLYQAVVVPVQAPVTVAWMLIGFRIDDGFAKDLETLTSSEVSFVHRDPAGTLTLMASTLPMSARSDLIRALRPIPAMRNATRPLHLERGEYFTLGVDADDAVQVVLQRPLTEAMRPFHRLQWVLAGLFVAALVVSVAAGVRIARGVSRPLLVLADGARRIEHGDYAHRVHLAPHDEFGVLADAFNNMARGISEREAQLKHQAYHDALTGLPNRSLFHHLLQQAVAAARRDGTRLAVLLLDLDRFKEVNDTLGHNIGDQILQQVGPRLKAAVREADTVARLGGDECAVLLRSIGDVREAIDVVERIRAAVDQRFVVDEQPIDLSASVGIAVYPDHGEDGTTLVRRADVAMYAAKRAARGVAVYDADIDPNSPQRLTLVAELRQALDEGGLVLHYQPKVNLDSGRVIDVETLARWQHPQHGLLQPAHFIELAEQTGLIKRLTLRVLADALRQWTLWRADGLELGVAVNLSARVLQDEELPDRVGELLAQYSVPAGTLTLEITESALMADPASATRTVARLDTLGVRLAIDDFGTGYSSLTYLKDLPVDELKIDKSFVVELAQGSNEVIVRSTIDLAHNLNISVTAEGVETAEACWTLARHGCDQAQGFFISRPLPADELTRWVRGTMAASIALAGGRSAR